MTFIIFQKSVIDSAPHLRVLERAKNRILRQIALRKRQGVELPLDSAHLESALEHHIQRYGAEGLIRAGMLLRGASHGQVSASDIKLLQHMPFKSSKKNVGQLIKRARAFANSPQLEGASPEEKRRISNMSLEKMLMYSKMGGYNELFDRINYEREHYVDQPIIRLYVSMDKPIPDSSQQEELEKLFTDPKIVSYVNQYFEAEKIATQFRVEREQRQKALDIMSKYGKKLQTIFPNEEIREYIQNNPARLSKLVSEIRLVSQTKKAIAPLLKIQQEYDNNPYLERYAKLLWDMDLSHHVKVISHNKLDKKQKFLITDYSFVDEDNNPDLMQYVEAFMPKASREHAGGKYLRLYHSSESPSGFAGFDPGIARQSGHYGLGTYATMIPGIAREFANVGSRAKYFATIPISRKFKFLRNDKEYGRGKEGKELVANIHAYFDDLAEKMNRPDLKGIFQTALDIARGVNAGTYYNYDKKVHENYDSQMKSDEQTDRYGYRGLVELNHPSFFGAPPYGGPMKYGMNYFSRADPSHLITVDKNEDGSQKIKLPGWMLHKAIKLAFEHMGAMNSGDTPSVNTGTLNKSARNSSYHLSMLLSSLGYHGYMHVDPETRQWAVQHAGALHPDVETDLQDLERRYGVRPKVFPQEFLRKLKTVVLFPSALADIPRLRWNSTLGGKDNQQDPAMFPSPDDFSATPLNAAMHIMTTVPRQSTTRPMHTPGIFASRGNAGRFTSMRPSEMTRITPAPDLPSSQRPASSNTEKSFKKKFRIMLRADR